MSGTNAAAQAKAGELVHRGLVGFQVLSTQDDTSRHHCKFIVAVPMAVMRNGILGTKFTLWRARVGVLTKFGVDVLRTLSIMDGVELDLDSSVPHIITLYVDDAVMTGAPDGAFHEQSLGLPEAVCVAIQAAIIRNGGVGQRAREYLRRLF